MHLEAGESKTVTMTLEWPDFACFHSGMAAWVVNPGEYQL
ncbi:fibronectin type III-like domain-contianing protein, partial [Escherichia coli]